MKNYPLISIVTVTYNVVNTIEKTILSIINQTYSNIEYIIIDGGSTDGTIDIIKKYTNRISYWISEPDNGIYDAMNKAINIASGDWIIFINAGDRLYNNCVINEIFNTPFDNIEVLYGDFCSEQNNCIIKKESKYPFYKKKSGYRNMGFSHQSAFVRTKWAKKYPFDLSYKCCADYNMMYTIYNVGGKFHYINKIICINEGGKGFSEDHRNIQMYEEAKICKVENNISFIILYYYRFLKRLIHKFFKI